MGKGGGGALGKHSCLPRASAHPSGALLPGVQGSSQAVRSLGVFVFDPETEATTAVSAALAVGCAGGCDGGGGWAGMSWRREGVLLFPDTLLVRLSLENLQTVALSKAALECGLKLSGGRWGEAPSGVGSLHDIPSPPVWQQVEGDSNHPLGVPASWALVGGGGRER